MTPFMLRVVQVMHAAAPEPDETPAAPPAVRDSAPKSAPNGADEQVALRALTEQLVSEANAVLHGRPELVDLEDQLVDGELGYRISYAGRAALVRTRFHGGTAVSELVGVGAPPGSQVELTGPDELANLILLLLDPAAVQRSISTI